MSLKLSGVTTGVLTGGPSSIRLEDLADVGITSPTNNQLLKYNSTSTDWENSALSLSDVTTALGYTPVNKAGDTMTGALVLNAGPSVALGAATKQYVDDTVTAGIPYAANRIVVGTGTGSTTYTALGYNNTNGSFTVMPPDLAVQPADTVIRGANTSTDSGGSVVIETGSGGAANPGGTLRLTPGNGGSTSGQGGRLLLNSGNGSGTNGQAGQLDIFAGSGNGTGSGGTITLQAGSTSGAGSNGRIAFFTSGTERMRISPDGSLSVGPSGTNVGTPGQVLTSNGTGSAPTWTTVGTDKAPIASPTFTGDPKAPTPALSDNDTSIATTAFVRNEFANGFSGGAFGFKNKIINGNFDIWQRNTSHSTNGYGSADRWNVVVSGNGMSITRTAFTVGQTDVPGNPTYFAEVNYVAAAGSGNYSILRHSIEDVRTFSNTQSTLSFWIRSTSGTKDVSLEFEQSFGSGGSTTVTGMGIQKYSITTTWTKITKTVTLASISGKTIGTSSRIGMNLWLAGGSDYNSRNDTLGNVSGTVQVARFQWEEGSAATPFEQRQPAIEFTMCQRYYQTTYQNSTPAGTASTLPGRIYRFLDGACNYGSMHVILPVVMRTTPTVNVYNPNTGTANSMIADAANPAAAVDALGPNSLRVYINNVAAGVNVGIAAHYTADAEL